MKKMIGVGVLSLAAATGFSTQADVVAERTALWGGHPDEDCVYCKIQPFVDTDGNGLALMTYQHLRMTGMDAFYADFMSRSTDGGRTWSTPKEIGLFAVSDANRDDRGFRVAKYVNPRYHRRSGAWFSTGTADLFYPDDHANASLRGKIYQTYQEGHPYAWPIYGTVDAENATITACKTLDFPIPYELAMPFGQSVELEDGSVLLPFYYRPIGNGAVSRIVVVKYAFANDTLTVAETGTPLENPSDCGSRGICEPSIVRFNGKFYMTIRSDAKSYWATSDDGLTWTKPAEWHFTGGTALNTDSTQQHWAVVDGKLHLVYTRVHTLAPGEADVFRSRAPLYMNRVDVTNMLLYPQADERALVPNRGARLGNFCIAGVPNADENWLVVAEWMQNDPKGWKWTKTQDDFAKYGADNSIWFVRLRPETDAEIAAREAEEAKQPESAPLTAYYLNAASGDDGNNGLSSDTPMKTIKAVLKETENGNGGIVYLADGTYDIDAGGTAVGQISSLTKPFKLVGASGNPAAVVICQSKTGTAAHRLFLVGGATASTEFELRNLTLTGGVKLSGGGGSAINFSIGRVANCIIRGNGAVLTQNPNSVVYMGGSAVMENCLIYGNSNYETAQVQLADSAAIVNCTIIGDGARPNLELKDASRAINCADFGGTVVPGTSIGANYLCHACDQNAPAGSTGWIKVHRGKALGDNYSPKSPLVGKGSVALYQEYATSATDLAGKARIRDGKMEIGCYCYSESAPLTAYYLNAASGLDTNDGLSSGSPKKTIKAVLKKTEEGNGGIVYLADGTYDIDAGVSGTDVGQISSPTKPFKLVGASGNPAAVVVCQSKTGTAAHRLFGVGGATASTEFELRNLTLTGGVKSDVGGSAVNFSIGRIANCIIRGNGSANSTIYMFGTAVMENCLIYGNSNYGTAQVQLADSAAIVNCTLIGNGAKPNLELKAAMSRAINCADFGGTALPGGSLGANYFYHACDQNVPAGATGWIKTTRAAALDDKYKPLEVILRKGNAALYQEYATSATDLEGKRRILGNGKKISIGAVEDVTPGFVLMLY